MKELCNEVASEPVHKRSLLYTSERQSFDRLSPDAASSVATDPTRKARCSGVASSSPRSIESRVSAMPSRAVRASRGSISHQL
jgi:hypothetical protein